MRVVGHKVYENSSDYWKKVWVITYSNFQNNKLLGFVATSVYYSYFSVSGTGALHSDHSLGEKVSLHVFIFFLTGDYLSLCMRKVEASFVFTICVN